MGEANLKKNIGLVIVLALVLFTAGNYIKQQIGKNEAISDNAKGYEVKLGEDVGLQKGQQAPDFTLTNLQGDEVTLSELQGKKVILNFWATWCPPCKAEMPHMQDYYKDYADKDNVEIVGVNLTYTNEKIEFIEQFVESYKLTFPILLEKTEVVAKKYEILTIPSTFFIDTEGKIQQQIIGPLDTNGLRDYVSNLN